jgi:hypothetical protein
MEEDPTMDEDSFDEDHSGRACSSTDGNSAVNATPKEQETIAKDEDRAVFRLRLLVIGVLVASTVGVAFAVYYYISKSENREFEENFSADAKKVLDSLGSSLELTLSAVDALVVNIVSYAILSNSSWPFVTVPDFAVRANKIQRYV